MSYTSYFLINALTQYTNGEQREEVVLTDEKTAIIDARIVIGDDKYYPFIAKGITPTNFMRDYLKGFKRDSRLRKSALNEIG